ncbi:MAG: 2Fe-2S iron-sulfur cluster-binding protein [Flavobacteriaceae bacterium]
MSDFYPLKVAQLKKITPNAVAISFEIPGELKEVFTFKAGQYITIKHHVDGKEIRRAYSISSGPEEEYITVGIKKVPSGLFSVHANTSLKEGDVLQIMPPEGRFIFEPTSKPDHVIAFAAGSGITPVMSIIRTVLESDPDNTMVLVYGNQNREETMFYEHLMTLKEKYTDRFFIQFLYSRAHEENSLFGRIEGSTVNYISRNVFKDRVFSAYYLCGPELMIQAVSDGLKENGVLENLIFTELFSSPTSDSGNLELEEGMAAISVTLDEEEFNFTMNKKKLLLDTVLDHDIDAPYSCQGGVCSTCIARIKEGTVVMEQNQILTDSEIEEGLILTCQSHPTSQVLKIDYDDV